MEEPINSSPHVDSTLDTGASSTISPQPEVSSSTSLPATPITPSTSATPTTPPTPPSHPQTGRKFLWLIILILLFVGFLVGAAWYFQTQLQNTSVTAPSPTPSTSSSLPKKLIIGTDPTFQPMEYMQNGKIVGYDIDLANLLAKQLGVQVQFKSIVFDNLFTALDQRQIDMIIAAVTITAQRQKGYDFSEPYINAGEVIITQKTNSTIKSPASLKGRKIGVQKGTTLETEALKYTANDLVIRYPDFVKATKALVEGQVDAIITDLPSAQGIIFANPTLKISSDPFTNEYYGIVFRKGDPIQKPINNALDSLRVRGYLTELKHKWLY